MIIFSGHISKLLKIARIINVHSNHNEIVICRFIILWKCNALTINFLFQWSRVFIVKSTKIGGKKLIRINHFPEEKQVRDETTQENKNKRAFDELRAMKLKPRSKEPAEVVPAREGQAILLSSLKPQRSSKKLSVQIDKKNVQSTAVGKSSTSLPQDYRSTS